MGTPDLQLQTLPFFFRTAKSHDYRYMDQKYCRLVAQGDQKWGLITLMIFSAAPDYRKCVYKNAFHTSPFFSPTSQKLLLVFQKSEQLRNVCVSLSLPKQP